MQKIEINCSTGETVTRDLTVEELEAMEKVRLAKEQEEAKPKPPTVAEQLAVKNEEISQLNLQVIDLWEVLISGGVI